MKFISKTLILSKYFDNIEAASDWVDEIIKEYDEYTDVGSTIRGDGFGAYTAEVSLYYTESDDGASFVSEGSREPDLFDPK